MSLPPPPHPTPRRHGLQLGGPHEGAARPRPAPGLPLAFRQLRFCWCGRCEAVSARPVHPGSVTDPAPAAWRGGYRVFPTGSIRSDARSHLALWLLPGLLRAAQTLALRASRQRADVRTSQPWLGPWPWPRTNRDKLLAAFAGYSHSLICEFMACADVTALRFSGTHVEIYIVRACSSSVLVLAVVFLLVANSFAVAPPRLLACSTAGGTVLRRSDTKCARLPG